MFYHLEHHLFPAVPTIKLPELAKRIDEVLPEIEKKGNLLTKKWSSVLDLSPQEPNDFVTLNYP